MINQYYIIYINSLYNQKWWIKQSEPSFFAILPWMEKEEILKHSHNTPSFYVKKTKPKKTWHLTIKRRGGDENLMMWNEDIYGI